MFYQIKCDLQHSTAGPDNENAKCTRCDLAGYECRYAQKFSFISNLITIQKETSSNIIFPSPESASPNVMQETSPPPAAQALLQL